MEQEGLRPQPSCLASSVNRSVALVVAGLIAVLLGSTVAAVLASTIGFVAGAFLDTGGRAYDQGEMNYGLGMLMVFIAFLAFLVLAPLLSFVGWRVLSKRFGPRVTSLP